MKLVEIFLRIVIDLDGVICNLKKDNQTYEDVIPLPDVIEKMNELKKQGHYIIINTSRHMLSTNHNIGLINKKVGKITLDWLDKYSIPYDEIIFGKPYGTVYIDDSAKRFQGWDLVDINDFNENKINIIIPMAGRGSRFLDAGYDLPKPLIKAKEKCMFEWAVKSFKPILDKSQLIFIVLKEHCVDYNLDEKILEKYPNAKIIKLSEITRGQAETVLKAKKYINNYNKLFIFNADTYFKYDNFEKIINNSKFDGGVICFEDNSDSERYSFAKADKNNNVYEVTEKKRISNYASNGLYYFKEGLVFVEYCEKMIEDNIKSSNEFYIMPMYQMLIDNGKRIKMVLCNDNWVFGTPEELKYFEKNY
jgi:capsule biosynthesis phosphatase